MIHGDNCEFKPAIPLFIVATIAYFMLSTLFSVTSQARKYCRQDTNTHKVRAAEGRAWDGGGGTQAAARRAQPRIIPALVCQMYVYSQSIEHQYFTHNIKSKFRNKNSDSLTIYSVKYPTVECGATEGVERPLTRSTNTPIYVIRRLQKDPIWDNRMEHVIKH